MINSECFTKKRCKSKGFEILHRTRQIGGDEAKAVLVSFLERKQNKILQKELLHETGGNRDNIRVIGLDDLKKDRLIKESGDFVF